MLGDDFSGPDWKKSWDEVWTQRRTTVRTLDPNTVHMLITLNAQMNPDGSAGRGARREDTARSKRFASRSAGCGFLPGHNPPRHSRRPDTRSCPRSWSASRTAASVPRRRNTSDSPTRSAIRSSRGSIRDEFEQSVREATARSMAPATGGRSRPANSCSAIPTRRKRSPAPPCRLNFSRNGTFMAYRKLHQNVAAFRDFHDRDGRAFRRRLRYRRSVGRAGNPHGEDRGPLVRRRSARTCADGRRVARRSIANIRTSRPTRTSPGTRRVARPLIDFTYEDDPNRASSARSPPICGGSIPATAWRRPAQRVRFSTIAAVFSGAGCPTATRRRACPTRTSMASSCWSSARACSGSSNSCSSNGSTTASTRMPATIRARSSAIIPRRTQTGPKAKFVIPSDPKSGRPPFIVEGIPQFVETRGGEYFFVPSMTALRMIGMGVVDPT